MTTMDVNDIYAYPMSYDHKPSQKHELDRITNSGGFVNHFGRINGNLNLSRSIGDLKYKQVPGIPPEDQMITAEPDIMQVVLNTTSSSSADNAAAEADDIGPDEFLILGCDGIWDCVSNEEAVHFVYSRIDTKSLVQIGTELLDEIISDDPRISQGIGGDNMTIMIIDLQASKRTRNSNPNQTTTKTDTVVWNKRKRRRERACSKNDKERKRNEKKKKKKEKVVVCGKNEKKGKRNEKKKKKKKKER